MNESSSSKIVISTETDLYYGYICPFVGAIGVFLNLIVFIIFSNSVFKEILYKYLKLQALFIGLDLLFTSFRPVFYWKHLEIAHSYPAHLYEKYIITYGASVVEMSAFVCLVLATLNYYLLIDNLLASQRFFFSRVSYVYVVTFVVLVSVFLFLYQLFEYKIVCEDIPLSMWESAMNNYDNNNNQNYSVNQTKHMCDIEYEQFHYSKFHTIIEIVAFFIRDGLNLIILVMLNLMIFVRVKKGMNKKKSILKRRTGSMSVPSADFKSGGTGGGGGGGKRETRRSKAELNNKNNTNNDNNSLSNATTKTKGSGSENGSVVIRNHSSNSKHLRSISKTKYKLTIMVIMSSLNCAIGRLPIMIFFILRNFGENEAVLYFRKIAVVFVYLSYDFNFFFLYFTNKKFKTLFNRYFLACATCSHKKPSIRDRSATLEA